MKGGDGDMIDGQDDFFFCPSKEGKGGGEICPAVGRPSWIGLGRAFNAANRVWTRKYPFRQFKLLGCACIKANKYR